MATMSDEYEFRVRQIALAQCRCDASGDEPSEQKGDEEPPRAA